MKKFLILIFVLCTFISVYYLNNKNIEYIARKQNSFNIDSTLLCLSYHIDKKSSTKDLTNALNICAAGQRSLGITGDIFVIQKDNKLLFWDGSTDVRAFEKTKDLYLTPTGVCAMFKDPKTCIKGMNTMLNTSSFGQIKKWDFDDSTEWINFKYLPYKIEGKQYIINQGTQKDEATEPFNLLDTILIVSGAIIILLTSTLG